MNIIICDDNINDALYLKNCIIELFSKTNVDYKNISIYQTSDELLCNIGNPIDYLFLDMEIENTSGIIIGKKIREKNINCPIIITTYYAKYAIEGYKIDAIRYFIKPIKKELFILEMTPLLNKYSRKFLGFYDSKISSVKIYYKDILYIEYKERGTEIHYINGHSKKTTYSLKYWITKLNTHLFAQSHKAFLVNLEYISGFSKNTVILYQNEEIPLSRKYKKQFEESYDIFLNNNI